MSLSNQRTEQSTALNVEERRGGSSGNATPHDLHGGGMFSDLNPPPAIPVLRRQQSEYVDIVTRVTRQLQDAGLEVLLDRQPEARAAVYRVRPTGPVVLFKRIIEDWGLGEGEAAVLLGFTSAHTVKELYAGLGGINQRDATDRLRSILRIGALLDGMFGGDTKSVQEWLRAPQQSLDNTSPLAALLEGSMQSVLRVKQLAEYLSGR